MSRKRSLPHVRGGVSAVAMAREAVGLSSPRAWGCFRDRVRAGRRDEVFPTCVGVFLCCMLFCSTEASLPHVRGGVSALRRRLEYLPVSSPRAWGCFGYSLVAVQHKGGLPHVRGGVSEGGLYAARLQASSPRAWGCFLNRCSSRCTLPVFPTCVGVFLVLTLGRFHARSLPHVRGGVSVQPTGLASGYLSSPRAWGCF